MFYFLVQPELGYVWPLVVLKTMATGSSLLARAYKSQDSVAASATVSPSRTLWALAAGAAVADTAAWLAYIWGTGTEYATIVTALASLFSVITILLAWVFLRERLATNQWMGVAVILLGVLVVSV
jgi:uncharacterized membrane protein